MGWFSKPVREQRVEQLANALRTEKHAENNMNEATGAGSSKWMSAMKDTTAIARQSTRQEVWAAIHRVEAEGK